MKEISYGVRELQARLGDALRAVRRGDRVVITSHGKPVARIEAADLDEPETSPIRRKLARLAAEGRVRLGRPGLIPPFTPLPLDGLADQVLRDRR